MRLRPALLFYLMPLLLAAAVLSTVRLKTDLSAFVVAGDSAEALLLASEMQSGALSRRYLLSVDSGSEHPVDNAFIRAFESDLKAIDGIVDVWAPGQQNDAMQILKTVYGRYGSSLYSLDAERTLTELLTPEGLRQRAELLKALLLSPQATVFKPIALNDPLLLILKGFESVGGQMRRTEEPNGRFYNLILETAASGLDAAAQSRIQQAIHRTFDKLKQTDGGMRLDMTGVPVFATATQTLIQGDIARIGVLSSAALVGLFLLLFRSIGSLFQVFTLLVIAVASALLATQALFGYVHGMTVAIGSTLTGICIDYPIHAIAHAQAVAVERRSAVVAKIWPGMLMGGITTLIGYGALGISGYPGFRQVAVFAGAGIVTALVLTRFVLPRLIAAKSTRALKIPLATRWMAFCRRRRRLLIFLLVSLLSASLLGLKSLQWLEDMQELTPELNALKENDKRIRARMTSIEPGRFLLVTGRNAEDALRESEAIYTDLDRLKRQDALSDYFGLYPWLLSARMQQRNRHELHRQLTDEKRRLWHQALETEGLSV
ncbi:MAG: MMPL family transporter, partial [Gammaproteobacteria bacterium]